MKNKTICIFGPNIREGGGKVLFTQFIQHFSPPNESKKIKRIISWDISVS